MNQSSHWHNDAIFYNIYPLGAVNGKQDNDYVSVSGGIQRLGDWVGHIRQMGCNALYLGPVFESRSHGYDTTDYRRIDSRLGTNEEFAAFVEKCHSAGIRVVLDGVFNHTGRDFFAFRDLLQNRESSRYRDWYEGVRFGVNNPMDDGLAYKSWRGHLELPCLNPHCPAVREYLFETVRIWVQQFGIDGIRLDCADCLDMGFLHELRGMATQLKEDFWLMGEIIHGDYTRWANPTTLHAVTNYECAKGLYSSHNDGNLHEIAYSINRQFGPGGIYRNLLLYNFADNHDINRLADTVTKQEYLPTIYTLLYTMPGLPSLYYGSEWAIRGTSDRVTDWALRPQVDIRSMPFDNPVLVGHIAQLARARQESRILRHGDYTQITVSSHQFAFRRTLEGQSVVVAINIADVPATITVDAQGEVLTDQLTEGDTFPIRGGKAEIPLPPYSSRILCQGIGDVPPGIWEQKEESPAPQATKAQPTPSAMPKPQEPPVQPPVTAVKQPQASAGEVRVLRRQDIQAQHQNKHPGYEFFRYPVVSPEEGGRCRVSFYELPPGKSAYPYHYHAAVEEVFFILEGSGTLRTPKGEQPVASGDILFFPAGEKGAHKLTNTGKLPLRYLDFDTTDGTNLCFYPDSGKVGFRDGGPDNRHWVFRQSTETGYYEGE